MLNLIPQSNLSFTTMLVLNNYMRVILLGNMPHGMLISYAQKYILDTKIRSSLHIILLNDTFSDIWVLFSISNPLLKLIMTGATVGVSNFILILAGRASEAK
jgi:hypothetical protein